VLKKNHNASLNIVSRNKRHSGDDLHLVSLTVILFACVLIAVSYFVNSIPFIYSVSDSITTTISNNRNLTIQSLNVSNVYSNELPNSIKEIILADIVNKSKAAIVVGFIDPNGTKIYNFGNVSKENNNIPVNGSTFFDIGSITKTFTTLVLADMVTQGVVDLNDPIEMYLPKWVTVPQYHGTKITLENLATHTSGLPFMPSNIWADNTVGDLNPDYYSTQMYKALSNITLTAKPGTKFLYSDFGMGLLGHILSLKEGGISYEELVENRILSVLGMNDTKIKLSDYEINHQYPTGHLNGSEIETPIVPEVIAGAGALRSTANDMIKYLSANIGLLHTKLDTSIQLQQLIQHPAVIPNPMHYDTYVALGWGVLTNFGTETLTHAGAINGWNSYAGFIPPKQIGVFLLCSCDSMDVDVEKLGFLLLRLAGVDSINNLIEKPIK